MKNLVTFSEAASLGMHAVIYLAENPKRYISTKEIAEKIGGSRHHLAKVVGRLSQSGLVVSMSGPKGGVQLAKPPDEIRYIDIFQAIEGPISETNCFLGRFTCRRGLCVFEDIRDEIFGKLKTYFETTTIQDFLNKKKEKN